MCWSFISSSSLSSRLFGVSVAKFWTAATNEVRRCLKAVIAHRGFAQLQRLLSWRKNVCWALRRVHRRTDKFVGKVQWVTALCQRSQSNEATGALRVENKKRCCLGFPLPDAGPPNPPNLQRRTRPVCCSTNCCLGVHRRELFWRTCRQRLACVTHTCRTGARLSGCGSVPQKTEHAHHTGRASWEIGRSQSLSRGHERLRAFSAVPPIAAQTFQSGGEWTVMWLQWQTRPLEFKYRWRDFTQALQVTNHSFWRCSTYSTALPVSVWKHLPHFYPKRSRWTGR